MKPFDLFADAAVISCAIMTADPALANSNFFQAKPAAQKHDYEAIVSEWHPLLLLSQAPRERKGKAWENFDLLIIQDLNWQGDLLNSRQAWSHESVAERYTKPEGKSRGLWVNAIDLPTKHSDKINQNE